MHTVKSSFCLNFAILRLERASRKSKKNLGSIPKQFLATTYEIWDYRFYWNSSDKDKGIQVKTCVTLIIPENPSESLSYVNSVLPHVSKLILDCCAKSCKK